MNNMNEKKLEGATWLPESSKDGFKECKQNFLAHVDKRHGGELSSVYVELDGRRCEECWNLATRVRRSLIEEGIKPEGETIWEQAIKACGMIEERQTIRHRSREVGKEDREETIRHYLLPIEFYASITSSTTGLDINSKPVHTGKPPVPPKPIA